MTKRAYQICTHCVMDTSDSAIVFDANGICDHCQGFEKDVAPNWHPTTPRSVWLLKWL